MWRIRFDELEIGVCVIGALPNGFENILATAEKVKFPVEGKV
jgi:hypothetical protein